MSQLPNEKPRRKRPGRTDRFLEHLIDDRRKRGGCANVLLVDRTNGPAQLLMDTLSRLVEGAIAITSSASPTDALIALNEDHFDLVVIGLQPDHTIPVNFVARLRGLQPDLPILAVGDPVAPRYADYVRKRGVHEVVNLPKSAAEMKNLAVALARRYLLSRD